MNEKLLQNIKENQNTRENAASEEEKSQSNWLIFKAAEETYAIESSSVKELLRNNEIFPVPFVPSYIKGVLNCYGEPYAVIDLARFLSPAEQNTRLFMIINSEDAISLQITDIVEFQNDNDAEIQKVKAAPGTGFFTGAITFDGQSIPVISIEGITSKIRTDLGNS